MHIRFIVRLSICASVLLFANSARTESYGHIPEASVYLGRGFDPLHPQKVFPICVKAKGECQVGSKDSIACLAETGTAEPKELGNTTTFSVKQIKSKYEFFREVNITASLSGGYGPFSGAASFSSYSMDEVNEDSLSWMISAKTSYGAFSLKNPELSPTLKLQPAELVAKCGPHYVAEVDRGVIAAAIFTVYNLDEKHKREIRASLSAGFSTGAFDLNGDASYKEVVRTAMQYGSMSIRVYTIGGTGTTKISELVSAEPTDLAKVKAALKSYVETQDMNKSAVVGFRTAGFGKLTNNPSIDPDQTSFLYYFERANEYRLQLIDGLRRTADILAKQRDFDRSTAASVKRVHDRLQCELEYAEAAMQSCRLSFEQTRKYLVDGNPGTDRAAELAMSYGLSKKTSGLKLCPTNADADARKFVSFGWARQQRDTALLAGLTPEAEAKSLSSCRERNRSVEQGFSEMLQSAGATALASPPAAPAAGGVGARAAPTPASKDKCVSGCDLDRDDTLLADANMVPRFPFDLVYWFDAALPSFDAKKGKPGLNIAVRRAQNIRSMRFYSGKESEPFAIRSNNGSADLVLFVDSPNIATSTTRIELDTVNNNTYAIILPFIKELAEPK